MTSNSICLNCGRTWQAHADEARARLATEYPGIFNSPPWDTDDARIESDMIDGEVAAGDWEERTNARAETLPDASTGDAGQQP